MDVGRNDRCPCGSGKKYKHCCIDKARGAASAPKAAPTTVSGGTCDGMGPTGRCGKPGQGTMWCKACGKLYVHCPRHQAEVSGAMSGHVLRMHPETIPKEKFDELLGSEEIMADLRHQAQAAPEMWKTFFEFIDKRQRGEAVHTPMPSSAKPQDMARDLRDRAIAGKGQMVRWYDGAWEFLLSFGMPIPTGEPVPMWGFSAKLYPPGRGSTESDWVHLGRWSSAVGVPEGQPEIGDTIRRSPNAVHKWMWLEAAPPEQPN